MEKNFEIRGIKRSELVNYFIGIDGKDEGCGYISGKDWNAQIGEETSVTLGSLKIPVVMVTFKSKKELFEEMVFAFRIKFLRMGG